MTSGRIANEKAQIGSLARAIYVQPSSFLLLVVESRSIGEMITKVNDLRSAGSRARAIKDHLKDDLGQLDSDLKKQQAARQEQVKLRDQKVADLAKLQVLQAKQIQAHLQTQDTAIAQILAQISSTKPAQN